MSQFLSAPNAVHNHEGTDYRADAQGILSVPDSLDPTFRNVHGLPTWFPAPAKDAQPVAEAPIQEHEAES